MRVRYVRRPGLSERALPTQRWVWIRWKTAASESNWHQLPLSDLSWKTTEILLPRIFAPSFSLTRCGFAVPASATLERWEEAGLPPEPRCVWCLRWLLAEALPPLGSPPGAPTRREPARLAPRRSPTTDRRHLPGALAT